MGKRRRAARCMVDNSHIPQDWYKAEQSRCSGINYCRFSRTWDICLANETKTALHGAQEQQTIDFTPTGEMLSTDGSGSIEIPELFTIKNNKTNVSYGMFRKHVYSNIAKILHEKHELGEVVLYDALCEELDAISDKHGLDKWKKSQPERSKREAVRQAGIQLQEIAVKKLGVQNYIVSYNTGLMRVA